MRVTTTPLGALVRWLVVVGNVAVVAAVATNGWQYTPILVLACAVPWLALITMAPWRYRERSPTGSRLRLLVFRRTQVAALLGAVAASAVALRFGHSWRSGLLLLVAAKLSLSDSLALWAPRGFDPSDPVWAKGAGLRRDRHWDLATGTTTPSFELEWSPDYDERVVSKAFRSCRWGLLRPAVTIVVGGLVLLMAAPSNRPAIAMLCAILIGARLVVVVTLEHVRLELAAGRALTDGDLDRAAFTFERNRDMGAAAALRRQQRRIDREGHAVIRHLPGTGSHSWGDLVSRNNCSRSSSRRTRSAMAFDSSEACFGPDEQGAGRGRSVIGSFARPCVRCASSCRRRYEVAPGAS